MFWISLIVFIETVKIIKALTHCCPANCMKPNKSEGCYEDLMTYKKQTSSKEYFCSRWKGNMFKNWMSSHWDSMWSRYECCSSAWHRGWLLPKIYLWYVSQCSMIFLCPQQVLQLLGVFWSRRLHAFSSYNALQLIWNLQMYGKIPVLYTYGGPDFFYLILNVSVFNVNCLGLFQYLQGQVSGF